MKTPDVSVRIITYNQRPFIERTIESVLAQETEYDYEIVVGEDCSTDGTAEIVREYGRRFPSKIRVLEAEENLGANQNDIRSRAACRGRYIALLDGDDYWTDPGKLQKQVRFLEENADFVMCFHNARVLDQVEGAERLFNDLERDEIGGGEMIDRWLISNSSLVYRNLGLEDPDFFHHTTMSDLALMLVLSEHGKIKYFPEVMSVYRIHERGLSTTGFQGIEHNEKSIELFRRLDAHLSFKYHGRFMRRIADYQLSTAVLHVYARRRRSAARCLWKALATDWSVLLRNSRHVMITLAGLVSPGAVLALRRRFGTSAPAAR